MTEADENPRANDIVSTLRERFVDSAKTKLNAIDAAIDETSEDGALAHTEEIRRNAHALKGMAGSFGFMSVSRISEAFEAYLDACDRQGSLPAQQARQYNAAMRAIIDSGDEPAPSETDTIIEDLPPPARYGT